MTNGSGKHDHGGGNGKGGKKKAAAGKKPTSGSTLAGRTLTSKVKGKTPPAGK